MARKSRDIRVADADRERVAERLRLFAGEGRLDTEELEERLQAALSARTGAELAVLTADLPKRTAAERAAAARAEFGGHLRCYLSTLALLVAIWALTGAGYFWPIWPALGWGIGIAGHWRALPATGRGRPRPAARTGRA